MNYWRVKSMASTETTQEIDMGHTDCEVCDEARAADDLAAQLEAAEAVALQIRAREVRVQVLEEALTKVRSFCSIRDSSQYRHIQTLCTLALADRSHERVG